MAYIYKQHRCIFFQVYRTGSSTIESLLGGQYARSIIPRRKHVSVMEFLMCITNNKPLIKSYIEYYKFSFVRNPFDLVASLYEHTKHFQPNAVELKTFDSFVDWLTSDRKRTFALTDDIRKTQWELLSDHNNEINLQFTGRFENFEADVRKLLSHLKVGIGSNGNVPKLNTFKDRDYKPYYKNKDTKNKIRSYFKKDLEYWNYDF